MSDENEEFNFSDYEVEVEEEIEEVSDESEIAEEDAPSEEQSVSESDEPLEPTEAAEEKSAAAPTEPSSLATPPLEPIEPENLQITVAVELGRMHISLAKLIELQQGNVLDVAADLTQPVNLMVEERCVGRGELIKVGDSLGVRILEMA